MAKSKPKRQPSSHSRAARRAASPSLPIPTSNDTTAKSPSPTPGTLPIPRTTPSGITKRTSKPLKRAQRLRQIRGMERAEENMDKLAEKVKGSIGREKRVRERRKGWEDVNEVGVKGKKSKKQKEGGGNAFAGLEEEGEKRERGWGDDEDMGVEEEVVGGATVEGEKMQPVKGVEEDELL